MKPKALFIHGLDSSNNGTKARYFRTHFPNMIIPDFDGDLSTRLAKLEKICENLNNLILIGSSFGGLMATCYASKHPTKISTLILLAPALNFKEFSIPEKKIPIPTKIIIGTHDVVTPPVEVISAAKAAFTDLEILTHDDDHLLRATFENLDWNEYLG